ncbi:unnamed protein product, partial [Strongylus vulgaris]
MEKLRQMLNPRPNGFEAFKQKITEWENSLPEAEKQAARTHREQMRKKFHEEFLKRDIPGVSAAGMAKLREIMSTPPNGREEFKQRMDTWVSGLSPADKAAAEAHR